MREFVCSSEEPEGMLRLLEQPRSDLRAKCVEERLNDGKSERGVSGVSGVSGVFGVFPEFYGVFLEF